MNKFGKLYQPSNVYEAAKQRFRNIIATFDDFDISFSGGKDSLTTILLAKEVFDEMKLKRKVNVMFFDEEFVYPETLETIKRVFALPFVRGFYFTVQMDSDVILPDGSLKTIIFWDENRKWIRPKPEGSISDSKTVYDLYNSDQLSKRYVFGNRSDLRLCKCLGIRADESMVRTNRIYLNYRRPEYAYIHNSQIDNFKLAAPIYDWTLEDVFYYLSRQKVTPINTVYWKEMLTKRTLRVDTPLHKSNRDSINKIKLINPEFWESILSIFPWFDASQKYNRSLKSITNYPDIFNKYGLSIAGVTRYVEENIHDKNQRDVSFKQIKDWSNRYILHNRFDHYHMTKDEVLKILFREIVKGNVDRGIMLRRRRQPSEKIAQPA